MSMFENFFGNKPGKGISKGEVAAEREKVTFSGYFKIYKRKFWQMIQLNFLTIIFFVPLLLLFVRVVSPFVFEGITYSDMLANSGNGAYTAVVDALNLSAGRIIQNTVSMNDLYLRVIIGIFFTAIPMLAIGPIQAGFTYILQSFIRERPVFVTSDLFKNAKKNFWISLIVSVIDIFFTTLIVCGLYFYRTLVTEGTSVFWTIGLVFMAIIFVVYMLMHLYIYPLIVTFNVNLKQLYKNAFFLAMTSFFPGLLILVIDALVIFVIYYLFGTNIQMMLLLVAGLLYATIGLINNYFSYKYMKFYLLDPALAAAEAKKTKDEVAVFEEK